MFIKFRFFSFIRILGYFLYGSWSNPVRNTAIRLLKARFYPPGAYTRNLTWITNDARQACHNDGYIYPPVFYADHCKVCRDARVYDFDYAFLHGNTPAGPPLAPR